MNNVFYREEGANEFVCYAYDEKSPWVTFPTESAAIKWVEAEKQWQKLRDKISNLSNEFGFESLTQTEAIEDKIENTNQSAEEFATEIKNYILKLFPLVKECQLKSKLLSEIENEFN